MKVSKVNHVKAGVKESGNDRGMLYDFPAKNGKSVLNTEEHVENTLARNQSKSLYNFFVGAKVPNPDNKKDWLNKQFNMKEKEPLYRQQMYLLEQFKITGADNCIDRMIRGFKSEAPSGDGVQLERLRAYKASGCNYEWNPQDSMRRLLTKFLRQKLRRTMTLASGDTVYIPDIIMKMAQPLCEGEEIGSTVSDEELKALLRIFNDDYFRATTAASISRSIDKQNVRITVDESRRLIPSNAFDPDKKAVFEFMKEYCASDDTAKDEMLRHMRAIILLFVEGPEVYEKAYIQGSSLNSFDFGDFMPEGDKQFCQNALDLREQAASIKKADQNSELKKKKHMVRDLEAKSTAALWDDVIGHYKTAKEALESLPGIKTGDLYWLGFCQTYAKKLLIDNKYKSFEKGTCAYLCTYIWKNFMSFIAMKYIDLGKAVYYFAMPDSYSISGNQNVKIGEVNEAFIDGFSSFDYEKIKAEETNDRKLAGYVTFAANNFNSIIKRPEADQDKNKEDALQYLEKNDIAKYVRKDAARRILMYFGGRSIYEGTAIADVSDEDMFSQVRAAISYVRNATYHFTGDTDKSGAMDSEILRMLFLEEYKRLGATYRKKYYSNNLPAYYSVSDINGLTEKLYSKPVRREAQIPAFNKVLARRGNELRFFLQEIGLQMAGAGDSYDNVVSALYFALKEIYYYAFLQEEQLASRFRTAILAERDKRSKEMKRLEEGKQSEEGNRGGAGKTFNKKKQELRAIQNFAEHMEKCLDEGKGLGVFCQQVMTEYNQQNRQLAKKPGAVLKTNYSTNEKEPQKLESQEIYQHYRVFLYKGLRMAFLSFLKDSKEYFFLKNPKLREKPEENSFVNSGWTPGTFGYLKDSIENDDLMLSFYVIAHFLNPRQLNHMAGSIRSYLQFIADIDRRAAATGNRQMTDTAQKTERYNSILDVLDFVIPFCGQTTNVLSDYFEGDTLSEQEDDFAKHVGYYVAFEEDYDGTTNATNLKEFCGRSVSGSDTGVGIFYDGSNPIINRNIVLSMMYGQEGVLADALRSYRYGYDYVNGYYKDRKRLETAFAKGECLNDREQKALRTYQNKKNRVELVDVMIFSEVINDFMSQLVGWSTLRERDLMYLQLGYYYTKLFHTQAVSSDSFLRCLKGEDIDIVDGAVLYQIVAMNSYSLPVYVRDQEGTAYINKSRGSIGSGVTDFYKGYVACWDEERYAEGSRVYMEGLCFFEPVKEHDSIVGLRNYIDHFKYYSNPTRSMLEMYSECYDRLLSYDTKLKNSVATVINNILLRYFVNSRINFGKSLTTYIYNKETRSRNCANIQINDLVSDYFEYKVKAYIEEESAKDNRKASNKSKVKNNQKGKQDKGNSRPGGSSIAALLGNLDLDIADSKESGIEDKKQNEKKKAESDAELITILIPARSSEFLKQIESILSYKKVD